MARTTAASWFSVAAVAADCAAAFGAVYLAVWLRFESGWFSIPFGTPLDLYAGYWKLALAAAALAYAAMRALKLYKRPQRGTFHAHVPRLIRGAVTTTAALLVVHAVLHNHYNFSSAAILLFAPAFSLLSRSVSIYPLIWKSKKRFFSTSLSGS